MLRKMNNTGQRENKKKAVDADKNIIVRAIQ